MAFPWDLAASAALPLLGGLLGDQWVGDTDSASGIDTMDKAIAYLEELGRQVPEISDQIVYWTDLIQQGQILPQDVVKIPEVQMAESKLRDFTPSTEFSIEVQFNKLRQKNNTLFIYEKINLTYEENTSILTSIFYVRNFGLNFTLHRDFQS